MASDKALSWVFAEEFVEENELLAQAREAATDLGADPVSTGVGAALRLLAATCGAKAVLEIGTGAGVSGLWLLQGMSPDGVLTTILPIFLPNVLASLPVARWTSCPVWLPAVTT